MAVGGDLDQGCGLGRDLDAALEHPPLDRERDDLDRRHHLLGLGRLEGGKRRDRDRLVDQVQPVDPGPVEDQEPGLLGEQVDPPGERLVDPQMRPGRRLREQARGLVLVHVVRPQPGGDHGRDPGRGQRCEVVRRQPPALAEDELPGLDRMGEDRALGLGQRQIAEPHAAGSRRSTAVISAITESATSAGLTAPIARPAGPWMRASVGWSWPSAPRRSSRAAWVRLLPRAAM